MGVVRFAIGFLHTFLCGRRPDPISGHDSRHRDARRTPAREGSHDKGGQFSKIFRYGVKLDRRFSTQERAALEWAEMLTLVSETHAPEEIYRDIADFMEKEMVDLTIAIGPMNVFDRIAIGFGCDFASA
jgi:alkylhydroperoxidase family enzyme